MWIVRKMTFLITKGVLKCEIKITKNLTNTVDYLTAYGTLVVTPSVVNVLN